MAHVIIGTAGHIDHGKTTLIRALTGIETDRLKEEKKRGITIELGFAYFDLPSGRRAGIVDVPGHERFIKHMLAGVGGIDLVLFVIAADEGVMPQTVEHLDILNMIGVEEGIIVITKADLADEEMIELVIEEAKEQVVGTPLEDAPVLVVSATTGKNLDRLTALIDEKTQAIRSRNQEAPARLNIDRVFTVKGYGTVITGTLLEGRLNIDDPIEIYPGGKRVKVRHLQIHGSDAQTAFAGQRTAINLAGVKREEIQRGDVIAAPDSLVLTSMIDVKLRLLGHAKRELTHGTRVRFYLGTRELIGRLILFEQDKITAGDEVYAQLRFPEELACKHGDRFVIRFYSPMETIGGGVIIDPKAEKHPRFDTGVIEEMVMKEHGSIDELIESLVRSEGARIVTLKAIAGQIGESEEVLLESIGNLMAQSILQEVDRQAYVHQETLDDLGQQLLSLLRTHHDRNPLKKGMGKEEIRSRLFKGMKKAPFEKILSLFEDGGLITQERGIVAIRGFEVVLTDDQAERVERIRQRFDEGGYKPPTMRQIQEEMSKKDLELLNWMIEEGILVRINADIIYEKKFYLSAKKVIIEYIEREGELSVKALRDLLDISRKYSVPLLEHLDDQKVTRRIEDVRVLF